MSVDRAELEPPGIRDCWREAPVPVKAVIIGIMVNRFGGFLQVFLVLYAVQRGFSEVQAGVALGALGAGAVVGTLGGGWLAARCGARATITGSMTATAVFMAVVPYTPDYVTLLFATVGVGTASQLYRPASAEVVSRLTPA
jgi:predicted MFS family arabinose efflux permease